MLCNPPPQPPCSAATALASASATAGAEGCSVRGSGCCFCTGEMLGYSINRTPSAVGLASGPEQPEQPVCHSRCYALHNSNNKVLRHTLHAIPACSHTKPLLSCLQGLSPSSVAAASAFASAATSGEGRLGIPPLHNLGNDCSASTLPTMQRTFCEADRSLLAMSAGGASSQAAAQAAAQAVAQGYAEAKATAAAGEPPHLGATALCICASCLKQHTFGHEPVNQPVGPIFFHALAVAHAFILQPTQAQALAQTWTLVRRDQPGRSWAAGCCEGRW